MLVSGLGTRPVIADVGSCSGEKRAIVCLDWVVLFGLHACHAAALELLASGVGFARAHQPSSCCNGGGIFFLCTKLQHQALPPPPSRGAVPGALSQTQQAVLLLRPFTCFACVVVCNIQSYWHSSSLVQLVGPTIDDLLRSTVATVLVHL